MSHARGTGLKPVIIILCAWPIVIGLYEIVVFVTAQFLDLVASWPS